MLKQKLILAVCVLATIFVACNNDCEDETAVEETYPVELSISFPEKSQEFECQGSNGIREIAALRTDTRYADKIVLSQSGGDIYVTTSEEEIDEETEFAFLYPASASTVATSDTLTQVLYIDRQNGTLEGLADFDYTWGTYTYDMEEEDYTSIVVMTSLMSFCKFRFTENGCPIERISQVIVTSPTDSLHVVAKLDLNDGDVSSLNTGSMVIQSEQGLLDEVYVAFFPMETALHFTVSTRDGKSYEAVLPEVMEFRAGETYVYTDIACSALKPAHIGDYYYNDATWSASYDENKTCVGIVYALDDASGKLDKNLTESVHGRVVALRDCASRVTWCSTAEDLEGIANQTVLQDTMYVGSLPYWNGNQDSFFSDDVLEQLDGIQIDFSTGQVLAWYTEGALSDFDGWGHASQTITGISNTFYAPSDCREYGQGLYGWYLPSAGELALLWALHRTGIICHEIYDNFSDFDPFGYWTSTEYDEGNVWYINFLSGIITRNSKNSSYNARPVIRF